MKEFIGRQSELMQLEALCQLMIAKLVVMTGRRRIGKSRLIREFANRLDGATYYEFSGLAPDEGLTDQDQRDEFVRLFKAQTGFPLGKTDDWGDLFTALAKLTQKGKYVILFDEISWMADGSPTCMPKLKTVWDTIFSQNNELVLVICGSVSSWIEKNILRSTGFFGRPSLHINLTELPLFDCQKFWGGIGKQLSAYEKLKVLALTGGVPRYLELINPKQTAEANFHRLCFHSNGLLFHEFEKIFSDIYGRRSAIYLKIIRYLGDHSSVDQKALSELAKMPVNGRLSEYLEDLCLGGFVAREYAWNFKSHTVSKLSRYRLKDNFSRFYLKYIEPNAHQIEQNLFGQESIASIPAWDTIMGFQFENLVLNNAIALIELLGVPLHEVLFASPYFQRKTQRQEGCQIDYLILTRFNTVYVCEIKFKRSPVGIAVINDVSQKVERLALPKNYSIRPVLVHVNGVADEAALGQYFSNIIDFATCFE